MSHADMTGEHQTLGHVAYVAELQCFLCGSTAGTIETDRKPLPPSGIWNPAAGGPRQGIRDWRQLRCTRCGGALFAESIDAVVRHDDTEDPRRDIPRRGRPPKWLVEERRRKRDAAESRI